MVHSLRAVIPAALAGAVLSVLPAQAETFNRTVPGAAPPSSTLPAATWSAPAPTSPARREAAAATEERDAQHRSPARQARGRACKDTEQWFLVFLYTPNKGFKGEGVLSIDIPCSPTSTRLKRF